MIEETKSEVQKAKPKHLKNKVNFQKYMAQQPSSQTILKSASKKSLSSQKSKSSRTPNRRDESQNRTLSQSRS